VALADKHIGQNWETFSDFCEKRVTGVTTGIESFDRVLLGLRSLVCIRGQPKTNKSTLALQISQHFSKKHGSVIYVDRENGRNRLRLRFRCCSENLCESDILGDKDQQQLRIQDRLFYLSTEKPEEIESDVKEALELYKKPCLVVFDSLQKLPRIAETRRDSIDAWLGFFEHLVNTYEPNVKVIFISEKNYSGYDNPGLGASKDSNETEYAAHQILDLRLAKDNPDLIICNVATDRDGPPGVEIKFEKVMSDPDNPRSFTYRLKDVFTEI
jgi:archaellum biogenesis ATPase FlaH